jgi:SAM-dependent methyltransferase
LTCQDISRRWLNACRKTLRRHGNVAFLQGGYQLLRNESYDVAYCHFVLHDIPERELERVIPGLAGALKPGGVLVFREPLKETVKLGAIKRLAEHSRLILKGSRITDIPMLGNALESIYVKE